MKFNERNNNRKALSGKLNRCPFIACCVPVAEGRVTKYNRIERLDLRTNKLRLPLMPRANYIRTVSNNKRTSTFLWMNK